MVKNILSIDVEEMFHPSIRQYREQNQSYRTPYNISPILKLLKEQNVKATFFIVGEIAEKFPEIVKMIIEEDHEIAFHGWTHQPLWRLTYESFRKEIYAFKKRYPTCKGYRAPSFSLSNETRWAIKALDEEGFQYDSSVFPSWTPLYGVYSAPTKPYKPSLDDISRENGDSLRVLEFPLAVCNFLGLKVPISGGFWLRFWHIDLIKRCIRNLNKEGYPAVVYVHNWELDPEIPKVEFDTFVNFATYHNLTNIKQKILLLLKNMPFVSFTCYLDESNV